MSALVNKTLMTDPPTVVGPVPYFLARRVESVPRPQRPEFCALPKPGERDCIASRSRSWLIETNEGLPPAQRFLFRVRQKNKIRGAVFVNVAKLRRFLKQAEMADLTGCI